MNPDSLQMKSSRYLLLRAKIVFMLFRKRKLTLLKLMNLIGCYRAYYLKSARSAKFPFAISFELSNNCNANCVFCRTVNGKIYNQNPHDSRPIAIGTMPYELATQVIDEAGKYLLMAIFYVNGEPLIYKRLFELIEYATKNNVASMIATNGILLTEQACDKLISSGIDFVKIAISGFSQDAYQRQVRFGSIEKIKDNLRRLQAVNERCGNKTIIMVDFMLYDYNSHEIPAAREYCRQLGFMFNVRQGNTAHLDERDTESSPPDVGSIPVCDWPWKVLTINWNGDVFPCCDYVVWSNVSAYRRIAPGSVGIAEVWNGEAANRNRKIHSTIGRSGIPICSGCSRNSITFKY